MKASNEAVYRLFNESLIVEKHVLSSTRDVYLREVACFLTFLEDNSFDIATVTTTNLMDYLVYRAENSNLSARTMAKIRTILKVFFGFINQENIRSDDPTILIPKNRIKKPLPQTIDYEAVDKILSSIDLNTDIGLRDRAMFELIYSCGLRVSECAGLKITDYYNREKRIVVTGKGDKQRMVPVGEMAIYYLDIYIDRVRPNFLKGKKAFQVFVSEIGEGLSRQQIWNRLKEYSEKAGVYSKVHTLRHSFATHMLKNGADLRSVQELLGHSDIRTTEIYTHVDTDKLLKEFEKAHPLEK